MTAKEIGQRAKIHKTKVSRAVTKLAKRRFVTRERDPDDRRFEYLELTGTGQSAYRDLRGVAQKYDAELASRFSVDEIQTLRDMLRKLA